jgi:PAS domain S-box-containing protein
MPPNDKYKHHDTSSSSLPPPDLSARVQELEQTNASLRRELDALRASEALYRSLHVSMSEGVILHEIVTDPAGKPIDYTFLNVNPSAERILSIPAEQFMGRRATEVYGVEQAPYLDIYARVAATGESASFETYFAPMKKHFHVSAFSPRQGQFATVFMDITEWVQTRQSLQGKTEELDRFFDLNLDLLCITDTSGLFRRVSKQWEELLGCCREELEGRRFLDFVHPDDLQGTLAALAELTAQRKVLSFVNRYRRQDGSYRWIEWRCYPAGDLIYSAARDITDWKEAEETLARYRLHLEEMVEERTIALGNAYERLQALSRLKDEFIANVSHEIRTPIANLKLYHHLLSLRPERHAEYLATLRRETDRLQIIVEDLLLLSRLDWNPEALEMNPLDLNEIVRTHVADRASLSNELGLSLEAELADHLPLVQADRKLIERVLSVLLTNSLSYTPSGGKVIVRTLHEQREGTGWVGFSVSDTGPGIPPEERPHLFERFYRGSVGRKSGVPGTGLGLSIAHEIVTRHHGRIEVASEGIGAVFTVWLPL